MKQAFSKIWLGVIALVLILGGILAWQFWPKVKPPDKIPEDLKIILRTGAGPFGGTVEELEIAADGSVLYSRGLANTEGVVTETKNWTGRITEEELKELLVSFYENNFFSLKRFYDDKRFKPDIGGTTITIRMDGETHSVSVLAGGPDRFWNVVAKIREIRNKIIAIPGNLELRLAPAGFLGKTPEETKENIGKFIESVAPEIEVLDIKDPNYWKKILTKPILPQQVPEEEYHIYEVNKIEKEAFVEEIVVTFWEKEPAWEIKFRKELYLSEIQEFLNKYPRLKEKLLMPLKLLDIIVKIKVPEGKEDEYIKELKSKYPDVVLEVKRVLPEM